MEPTRSFRTNKTMNDLYIYGGLAFGVVYFLIIMAFPRMPGYHFGFIVMFIAVGVWNASRFPVKCYEDYMEIKLAPASSLCMIRYSDITHLDNSHPKRVQIGYQEGQGQKMLKLPWNLLEEKAKTELVPLLEKKRTA